MEELQRIATNFRYSEASDCRDESVKFLAYANSSISTAISGLFEEDMQISESKCHVFAVCPPVVRMKRPRRETEPHSNCTLSRKSSAKDELQYTRINKEKCIFQVMGPLRFVKTYLLLPICFVFCEQ